MVIVAGRRARGPGDRRRADVREGDADQRRDVDGRRASSQSSGKSGEIVGQAGGVLIMRNIDSAAQIGTDEEVFTAGHRDQRRDPVAVPEGPRDRLASSTSSATRTTSSRPRSSRRPRTSTRSRWPSSSPTTTAACRPVDEQAVPCGDERHGARGRGPLLHAHPQAARWPEGHAQALIARADLATLGAALRGSLRRAPRGCASAPTRRAGRRALHAAV